MKRRSLAVLVITALLLAVPVRVHGEQRAGKIVWQAMAAKKAVATVTEQKLGGGQAIYEVWAEQDKIYQDYGLTSVGYNGRIVQMRVREIRPFQDRREAAKTAGMREPGTIFRAPKVVFAAALEADGANVFLEVREIGENYLIVITRILPKATTNEQDAVEL